MTLPLDHIAVAVDDLDQSQKIYEDLGLVFEEERETVESQGVITAFADIGSGARLELLAPWGEKGPIHKFLEKRGAGIHHICFRVPDVHKATCRIEKKGVSPVERGTSGGGTKLSCQFYSPPVYGRGVG